MKQIAVVAGGYSGESEVSMKSAGMVLNNIDRQLYHPTLVLIEDTGWKVDLGEDQFAEIDKNDFSYQVNGEKKTFDGVFVIVHGTPGEDGLLQAYFELIGMPHTTGSVWNMSTTFDKAACNNYLKSLGYKTAKNIRLNKEEIYSASEIVGQLGLPVFVKPNNGGSSIATSRVNEKEALHEAINLAFTADDQVIIEEFMAGKEVTCGVIQFEGKITALPITEIVFHNEFFDYEAKYLGQSEEITPARILEKEKEDVQRISEELYRLLNCRGMIRVDYILRDSIPYIIEVNTVPGFSEQSIIPQQAEARGMSKSELISAVIQSCF